jgi:hypothetical protein
MAASGNALTGNGCSVRHLARGARLRYPRRARIFLLLAALCALESVAAAGTVDIDTVVGFTDAFQPGRWTPLNVTVTNHGGDLSGELEVQVPGGDDLRDRPFVTSHRRKLDLHRASRKTLQFTVLPRSLFHPLVIRVHAGGRELARSEVSLRTRLVVGDRLLLVLSRDANLDYLNDRADDGLRVLYPHPELLPAHWRGYDAVAAMVVHGISLERLSADQFEALRKWVAQGGILAVSGGAEYALLRTPRLASLLPGLPSGMTRIDAAALKDAFSASLDLARPVHVNRVESYAGRARLRAGDMALIIERTLGLGRVLYLTFDVAGYPFNRWDGMRKLWRDNLRLPPATPISMSPVDPVFEGPLPALIRAESADFPSYVSVLLFLALYIGLLLAGYQRPLREGRLRMLAQIWSWPAPALFAFAAWLLFGPPAFPRGASAVMVAVIEPLPGSPYARLELDLGVYANRSGALRFEYRGAEPVLYPRQVQRGTRVGDWVFGEGPRPYLEPQDRRRYVLHALQGEDVIAFDLRASVYDETTGPRLLLDNASGRTLEDLRLVFDGHVYELGSVDAGARSDRRLTRRTHGIEVGTRSWRDVLKPPAGIPLQTLEPTRIVLERRSKSAGESGYPGRDHALLVGYTASPVRPAGASADWPRRERALVALRLAALPGNASAGRK